MKRQLEYDIRGSLPHTLNVPGYASLHIHHHSGALFSSTWQYVLQINADKRTNYFTLLYFIREYEYRPSHGSLNNKGIMGNWLSWLSHFVRATSATPPILSNYLSAPTGQSDNQRGPFARN